MREQLLDIVSDVNYPLGYGTGSYGPAYLGPPTAANIAMEAQVRKTYDATMAQYDRFLKDQVAPLNAALVKAGYQQILNGYAAVL